MPGHAVAHLNLNRICFIDDSKTSAFVTKKMLKQYGYLVDHFPDAESALEALMENDYALVITDLMISSDGGVNGDDLIRLIRHSGHPTKSRIPIVVVTGSANEDTIVELMTFGANKVLQKPLNGESLNETIQSLIQDLVYEVAPEPEPEPEPESATTQARLTKQDTQVEDLSTTTFTDASDTVAAKNVTTPNFPPADKLAESIDELLEIPTLTDPVESDLQKTEKTKNPGKKVKPESTKKEFLSVDLIGTKIENLLATDLPDDMQFISNQKVDTSSNPPATPKTTNEAPPKSHISEKTVEKEPVKPKAGEKDKVASATAKPAKAAKTTELEDNPLLALLDHMDDKSAEGGFKKVKKKGALATFQFKSWVPKLILAIIVLVVTVPAISFWMMTQKVVEVYTFKAELGPIYSQISVPARVESNRKIKVSAREAGQLVKVNVKEGDAVKKGQILAQLDDKEAISNIKRAQARLLSAEEEVALTSKTQERLQRALDVGAVSRQLVEDAEASWKTASARQSVIEEELKSAELKLERLKIRAPFEGVITAVYALEGQWVSQSEDLFSLVDMTQRVVKISVDASDSTSLSIGQTVMLRSGAFDGLEWSEKIIKISSAAKNENSANIITVTASLSSDAPELRIGQQIDAEIRTNMRNEAILLPYEALFNHNGQQTVAVIENSKIVFVPVQTGIESFTRIEITKGIRAGQEVVIPTNTPLEPGMNVVVVGTQAL